MTVDIYSKYKHPSAAETAARAKEIVRTKCLVQSRSVVTCSVQDAQDYLKNVKKNVLFRSRLRAGSGFLEHHDEWILEKLKEIPEDVHVFSYYSLDIGIPLKVCGLYNTRVRVKWLNHAMRITEEPSTWLQNVSEEGFLPRKLYYGEGFRYEI
mgnify:CR=1 FL=1